MGRIKRAFRDLSIRKTYMLYMLLFLLLAALLSSISINIASGIVNNINLSYGDTSQQYTLQNGKGDVVVAKTASEYLPQDKAMITLCNIVETWSIPLFFGLCIIASALLFYRIKLKKPIELLSGASQSIAANNLDFSLHYGSKDEMGRLCDSFEKMRVALLLNNRELWRAVEERKRLNAAFSHDLRTPLTVLRGYADFLNHYVPQGKIGEEKILTTVSTMSEQIDRLESYVRTMSDIQRLEDIVAAPAPVRASALMEQLRSSAQMLAQKSGRNLVFDHNLPDLEIGIDASFAQRVSDNLLSNAARYAAATITVRCWYEGQTFYITVEDDGPGFTADEFNQASKPYYRQKTSADGIHFGLGLHICKTLCEKHGGQLTIGNRENGGASVTASFLCRNEQS